MIQEREIDPRLEGFRAYLDEQVATQQKRPYSERGGIREALQFYAHARQIYLRLANNQITSEDLRRSADGMSIECLGLSRRTCYIIKRNMGIDNTSQLIQKTASDLLTYKGMGKVSIKKLKEKLSNLGLELKE